MGYSRNPDRVRQLLPYLTLLMDGRDCYWNLTGRKVDAETFAYRVREALYISKSARDPATADLLFPGLAAVAEDITIEVEGSVVRARFGNVLDKVSLPQDYGTSLTHTAFAQQAKPIRYELATIQALWSKRQGTNINLPMYLPDEDELLSLYTWAQSQSPVVMLMPSDTALTLIEYDSELEGVDWTPADIQSAPS